MLGGLLAIHFLLLICSHVQLALGGGGDADSSATSVLVDEFLSQSTFGRSWIQGMLSSWTDPSHRHDDGAARGVSSSASFDEFVRAAVAKHSGRGAVGAGDDPEDGNLIPVVIIPPLTGTFLQGTLHNAPSHHWYCAKNDDSKFTLWLSTNNFSPFLIDCWTDHFSLRFNKSSMMQSNASGVSVTFPDYGGLYAINYLDPVTKPPTLGVWNETVSLLQALGYVQGKTLFGAPYDFRLAPQNWAAHAWPRLRALIERASALNGGRPVCAVSLSMGGPYFLSFLNAQPQAWKDKYMRMFVSMDGAFGGALSAVETTAAAKNWLTENIPFGGLGMTRMLRTFGSVLWLYPARQAFNASRTWVSTPSGNFSSGNWEDLLAMANATDPAGNLYASIEKLGYRHWSAPGVETHLIHGYNVSTPSYVRYASDKLDSKPIESEFQSGDGTLLVEALTFPVRFNSTQYPIYTYPIANMFHGSSVHNADALRRFLHLLKL